MLVACPARALPCLNARAPPPQVEDDEDGLLEAHALGGGAHDDEAHGGEEEPGIYTAILAGTGSTSWRLA